MFADRPTPLTQAHGLLGAANSKTSYSRMTSTMCSAMDLIIKSAPGIRPVTSRSQIAKTGPVLISGDLYHYLQERTLDRVPTFEFNAEQTRATRRRWRVPEKDRAQLWIQHDFVSDAKLKKRRPYYDRFQFIFALTVRRRFPAAGFS